ncbi:MAG TPA: hypothetical protein VD999_00285 [Vitreimonas sp.]|nr:hypothetical protein [Vitreimonas sp.]
MPKISCQLDTTLYQAFSAKAARLGYPKSKVLRTWLSAATIHLNLSENKASGKKSLYTVTLSPAEITKLKNLSTQFNLSLTKTIHFLILNNVELGTTHAPELPQHTNNNLKYLWQNGQLLEIIRLGENQYESLCVPDLLYLVQAYSKVGRFDKGTSVLTHIDAHRLISPHSPHYTSFLSLKASCLIHSSQDAAACHQLLNLAFKIAHQKRDRLGLGIIHRTLGTVYFYEEKIQLSLNNYLLSLDYLDPLEHPLEFTHSLLHLSRIYIGQKNIHLASYYLQKIATILETNPNDCYNAWYQLQLSRHYLQLGQYSAVLSTAQKSEDLNLRCGSQFGLTQSYRERAQAYLSLGHKDNALNLFHQSFLIDKKLRPNSYHRSNFYELYLRIEKKDETAKRELFHLAHHQLNTQSIMPDFRKYIYFSTAYILGKGKEEQLAGATGLKHLHQTSSYPGMNQATLSVLQTAQLQPLV